MDGIKEIEEKQKNEYNSINNHSTIHPIVCANCGWIPEVQQNLYMTKCEYCLAKENE